MTTITTSTSTRPFQIETLRIMNETNNVVGLIAKDRKGIEITNSVVLDIGRIAVFDDIDGSLKIIEYNTVDCTVTIAHLSSNDLTLISKF